MAGGGAEEVARQALAHADALYNFARWLARDPAEAEDLVQEAYSRALGAARNFEPGTNLKAWLMRILRNAFIDRRRRSQREVYVDDLDADGEVAEPVPGELQLDQIRALVAEDVSAAVRALPEPFRTVVLLDLEGMTEAEVASVLGCATGTVKSRLSRARAVLRDRLAAYGMG
ncbi:MAG TPA: sigma-70 family RNA polymerase sigma factor [Myxococcota bacterium]|nr:sigma-70 family RNA polymerase sigma factor [Myxococcota bacterium]